VPHLGQVIEGLEEDAVQIDHACGDVLDVAPSIAEATVLWLRSGFNHRFGTWRFGLTNRPLRALTPGARLDRPWVSPTDSVWELEPPMNQLRYVYVLANPSDGKGYSDLESVNGAVTRSLDVLSSRGVRTIAMIHIPLAAGSEPTDEEQTAAAEAMVSALRAWDSAHPDQIDKVVLVDLQDGFSGLV